MPVPSASPAASAGGTGRSSMRTHRLATVASSAGTTSASSTNTVWPAGSSSVFNSTGAASRARWMSDTTITCRCPSSGRRWARRTTPPGVVDAHEGARPLHLHQVGMHPGPGPPTHLARARTLPAGTATRRRSRAPAGAGPVRAAPRAGRRAPAAGPRRAAGRRRRPGPRPRRTAPTAGECHVVVGVASVTGADGGKRAETRRTTTAITCPATAATSPVPSTTAHVAGSAAASARYPARTRSWKPSSSRSRRSASAQPAADVACHRQGTSSSDGQVGHDPARRPRRPAARSSSRSRPRP